MVYRNHTRRAEPVRPRAAVGEGVYITLENGITDWSLNAMCLFTLLEWGEIGRRVLLRDSKSRGPGEEQPD